VSSAATFLAMLSQVGWLPDFCRMDTFFVVMVAVEIIVLAAVLMPDSSGHAQARDVFTASLFAHMVGIVILCVVVSGKTLDCAVAIVI
jgi:hypothetical protein